MLSVWYLIKCQYCIINNFNKYWLHLTLPTKKINNFFQCYNLTTLWLHILYINHKEKVTLVHRYEKFHNHDKKLRRTLLSHYVNYDFSFVTCSPPTVSVCVTKAPSQRPNIESEIFGRGRRQVKIHTYQSKQLC